MSYIPNQADIALPSMRGDLDKFDHKLHQISMEVKMLQLLALQKITADEFRSLMKMINSPDGENLHVAYETILNLIKDI